jgi:acetyl esterase/lipase
MKTRKAVALFVALILIPLALAGETREESIERENRYIDKHPPEEVANYWRDVTFVEVDGRALTLDVSAPEGDGPFPILMIIHGGGWTLHTNTVMEGMARYITNRGYVVFNVNYRTLPEGATMEEIVEDVFGALLWIKEHAAEYKGDPTKICVTGDSAGGHLTAMIVTQGDNPAFTPTYQGSGPRDLSVTCAIPTYGAFDFVGLGKGLSGLTEMWFGEKYKDNPERYELLSPLQHVKPGMPPQFLIVGDLDPLYLGNKQYLKAVKKTGSPVEIWVSHGQTHAFLNYFWKKNGRKGYDKMIEFMDEKMK